MGKCISSCSCNSDHIMKGFGCQMCFHYKQIDSGYGYCKESPPQMIRYQESKWLFWKHTYYELRYPEIPWCMDPCGKFEEKSKTKEA